MLELDKSKVNFLVTENMVGETKHILNDLTKEMDILLKIINDRKIENVFFVACGSPLCACQTSQMLFEKYSNIFCKAYSGMDFLSHSPFILNKRSLVIGISDSGTTQEVYESIELAREKNAMTIGITKNKKGNPLAEKSEFVIGYEADCIWEVHLLITYYLSLMLIKTKAHKEEVEKILEDMKKIPAILERLLSEVEEDSKKRGEIAAKYNMIYTVAAGPLLPLAYKEGIITMLEFTWTHGSCINASEFRHGPLEVVENGVPYVFFLGNDDSRKITQRTIDFVKKLNKDYMVFDINDYEKNLHPMLTPMILFVPLEFFYYYLSIYKNHNPDDRRYYGGLVKY
ncbi:SIS domain-containing protein [Fusobacterium necrophorum]|uniref:Fructoselysine-6-P-deglycase n=3 Tax=Fusobacterium necrophorum TaxID=859 RepID=A0AB73BZI6_9FUSO|nr:SIS domain-containing protein [Fusobacterium necrophorum]AYZ74093.1 SIS domain-containing protein [Fusobacterium necrophorum]AZW10028.1 SIS domain-containing protein [Fusobacterium necrophorum subsp. necrophorum]KDE63609.1 hypothetical protein FUSO5_07605 [Fusobacterium necrophorum BFTR-1]KDE65356.1 fructoselysine-6-P-deglycase [Fusobacterium necrophorum BL]KDE69580.1 fructoselysine-6-P-deglycase [Fusobacterium necrophorum DAB]